MSDEVEARPHFDRGLIERFVAVDDASYDDLREMRNACERAAFTTLRRGTGASRANTLAGSIRRANGVTLQAIGSSLGRETCFPVRYVHRVRRGASGMERQVAAAGLTRGAALF